MLPALMVRLQSRSRSIDDAKTFSPNNDREKTMNTAASMNAAGRHLPPAVRPRRTLFLSFMDIIPPLSTAFLFSV